MVKQKLPPTRTLDPLRLGVPVQLFGTHASDWDRKSSLQRNNFSEVLDESAERASIFDPKNFGDRPVKKAGKESEVAAR